MFLPCLCCSFVIFLLSWRVTPRLQTASSAVPVTQRGTNWELRVWIPSAKSSPPEGTRHESCLQVLSQQVPRGWGCPGLELTTSSGFIFSGLGCSVETGIFTSNRNGGFSKRRWSKAIRAECEEPGAKPQSGMSITQKEVVLADYVCR